MKKRSSVNVEKLYFLHLPAWRHCCCDMCWIRSTWLRKLLKGYSRYVVIVTSSFPRTKPTWLLQTLTSPSGMGKWDWFPAWIHLLPVFSCHVDTSCLPVRLEHDLGCGWGLANPVVAVVLLNYFAMLLFVPLSDGYSCSFPASLPDRDFVESNPVSPCKGVSSPQISNS